MPKGRGSKSRRKGAGGKGSEPAAGARSAPRGLVGASSPKQGQVVRRTQAAEAGGVTRDERRRSRQRAEEAVRLAARRLAKAAQRGNGD